MQKAEDKTADTVFPGFSGRIVCNRAVVLKDERLSR